MKLAIEALREILKETDGRNPSHIGQDRAFAIAHDALRIISEPSVTATSHYPITAVYEIKGSGVSVYPSRSVLIVHGGDSETAFSMRPNEAIIDALERLSHTEPLAVAALEFKCLGMQAYEFYRSEQKEYGETFSHDECLEIIHRMHGPVIREEVRRIVEYEAMNEELSGN